MISLAKIFSPGTNSNITVHAKRTRIVKLVLLQQSKHNLFYILSISLCRYEQVVIANCYPRTVFFKRRIAISDAKMYIRNLFRVETEGNNLCSVCRRKSRLWNNTATLETVRAKRTWSRERRYPCQRFTREQIATIVDHTQVSLFFRHCSWDNTRI